MDITLLCSVVYLTSDELRLSTLLIYCLFKINHPPILPHSTLARPFQTLCATPKMLRLKCKEKSGYKCRPRSLYHIPAPKPTNETPFHKPHRKPHRKPHINCLSMKQADHKHNKTSKTTSSTSPRSPPPASRPSSNPARLRVSYHQQIAPQPLRFHSHCPASSYPLPLHHEHVP